MKPMSCRGELISLKVVPAGNEDSAHSVEDERSSSACQPVGDAAVSYPSVCGGKPSVRT